LGIVTEVEAAKLVTMMVTAWPEGMRWLDEDQQAETRGLYRRFLVDLPFEAGMAAVVRLIATWRPTSAVRWPSIAELRGAIALYTDGRPMTAGEAWGSLRKLGRWMPRAQLARIDPTVFTCLDSLGWIVWTDVFERGESVRSWRVVRPGDTDSEAADRARFLELYEQLTVRGVQDRAVGALAPPVEVRRIAAPAPELVGDIVQRLLPKDTKS
jgi:hypothetical protein